MEKHAEWLSDDMNAEIITRDASFESAALECVRKVEDALDEGFSDVVAAVMELRYGSDQRRADRITDESCRELLTEIVACPKDIDWFKRRYCRELYCLYMDDYGYLIDIE